MGYSIVFNWLLKTSLMAGVLVVAIMTIKKLLNNSIGAKWHYYIWMLLVIRLVLPYAPESSFSIFNLQDTFFQKDIIEQRIYQIENSIGIEEEDFQSDPQALITVNNQNNAESDNNNSFAKLGKVKGEYNILFTIWLLGIIILSIITMLNTLRMWIKLKNEIPTRDHRLRNILDQCKSIVGMNREITLIKTNAIDYPALYGIKSPKILIPEYMSKDLTDKQLQHVILHELGHLKRQDVITSWLTHIIKIVHWFNPIIWYGFKRMNQDKELACDAYALKYIEESEYISYGDTIIKILSIFIQSKSTTPLLSTLGHKSQLKRRVEMIKLFNKRKYKISLGIVVLFVAIGVIFLTNQKPYSPKVQASNVMDLENNSNVYEASADEEDTSTNSRKDELEKIRISLEDIKVRLATYEKNSGENKEDYESLIRLSLELENKIKEIQINKEPTRYSVVTYSEGIMKWPLKYNYAITSPFGNRVHPITGEEKLHTGIDIAAKNGTNIIAAKDGKVVFQGWNGEYGLTVIIDHGNGISTVYAQCSSILVEEGQMIKAGEEIAKVGSTGQSTGPHLHFEVRVNDVQVNPLDYFAKDVM